MRMTEQDHGTPVGDDQVASVVEPDPEHSRDDETAATVKNGACQKDEGPFRMHQVPWIGIR